MNTKPLLTLTLVGALHAVAASADYDLFSGAQYPGGIKKPGVGLYEAKQTGGRYAGSVAAPVAAAVMKRALPHLGVPPRDR